MTRRKRPTQFTPREALTFAQESGNRRIETLTERAMTYAAAVKRLPKDGSGFLILDEPFEGGNGKFLPAVLTGQRKKDAAGHDSDPVVRLNAGWEGSEEQGYDGPGWYFWDEVWAFCYGPFDLEGEAREALKQYCKEVLGD